MESSGEGCDDGRVSFGGVDGVQVFMPISRPHSKTVGLELGEGDTHGGPWAKDWPDYGMTATPAAVAALR